MILELRHRVKIFTRYEERSTITRRYGAEDPGRRIIGASGTSFVLMRRRRRSERNGVENVQGSNEDHAQDNFLIFTYSGILWSIFKSASRLSSERRLMKNRGWLHARKIGKWEYDIVVLFMRTISLLFDINIYEMRQFKSTVGVLKRTNEF